MGKSALGSIGYRVVHGHKLIPTVKRCDPPKGSTAKTDTTAQDNANGVKSRSDGWKDVGDMFLTINDIGGSLYAELYALWIAGTKENWIYQRPPLSGGLALQGMGFISGLTPPKPADDGGPQTIEVTVTPEGEFAPVATPATGLTTPWLVVTDDDSHVLALTPAAAGSIYDFSCKAYSTTASVTITPTFTAGSCYVNGVSVETGVASSAITIDQGVGDESLIGIVVEEVNKGPRTYLVRVEKTDIAYSS